MIRPERFYLFYIGRCPICFLQNISLIRLVVLKTKIFEGFLPYLGMAAILNFGSKPFYFFSFPQCLDATYEIWLHLARWFQRRSRLKVWTDDGRTTEASHTISSPGAFGSGELKNNMAMMALDRSPELRRQANISHESNGINGMRNADERFFYFISCGHFDEGKGAILAISVVGQPWNISVILF